MLAVIFSGFVIALAAPWLVRKTRAFAGWILALLPGVLTLYLLWQVQAVSSGQVFSIAYDWVPSLNVTLSFYVDGLSLLFALLITAIGTLIVIYAGGYLAEHPRLGRFYFYIFSFMASMLGLVFADNLLTLFVFWELTSLTSYLLIGFERERDAARSAALQSLLVTGGGGLALLAGLLLLGQVGQTFELSALLDQGDVVRFHELYLVILLLILTGAFTKSAQVPFHFWLPGAMEAPTPVSAYLHSSTMVKAGIYLLARLSPILGGTNEWLYLVSTVGVTTMLVGAYLALQQSHLKRLLAYSTVSALGALTLLLGVGSVMAVKGAVVFLLAHALYKAALFMAAGAIIHETGESSIERLRGLRSFLPVTSAATFLAALSMAGIPPWVGFIGKEMIYEAIWDSAWAPSILTAFAVTASALLVAVAALVAVRPFVGSPSEVSTSIHEAPVALWLGPVLLAVSGLAAGLLANPLGFWLAAPAVGSVLRQETVMTLAFWHGMTPAVLLDGVAVAGGVGVYAAWGFLRRTHLRIAPLLKWSAESCYRRCIDALNSAAAIQTRFLQSGYLRFYLMIVVATTLVLVGTQLAKSGAWSLNLFRWSDIHFHEFGLVLLILGGATVAATSRSRFTAIAALGVVGYAVAVIYVLFGAPDLAMTQFVIETLTVILFVLVFYHLPPFTLLSKTPARVRDSVLALLAGGLMTALVLVATATQFSPAISGYYTEHSLLLAHGRNIVNVILVDFRGLDTLGEITVVALAALGVYALIKLRPGKPR